MPIQVFSETAPLKTVLLHRPGRELEHLVPGTMGRLLFDDIPYLAGAQEEHDRFAALLRENGVSVKYLTELMAEALAHRPDLRTAFLRTFIQESGPIAKGYENSLLQYLLGLGDNQAMIQAMVAGVRLADLGRDVGRQLPTLLHREAQFLLDPIPNLYFTRDPFAAIGNGASLHRMFSETRARETLFGDFILRHHPDFAGRVPLYYSRQAPFSLEGGDILNLSARVLAVGASERTMPEAIEDLALQIFADPNAAIETILVLDIPGVRAYMHLDTVFTQVDRDTFVIHPGIMPTLRVFTLEPGGKNGLRIRELDQPLARVLAKLLDLPAPAKLLFCGGQDAIAAQREQWNDGANTLCLSPGVVVTYDRNQVTNRLLEDNGIRVLSIPSSELSRGRGGPRCMSMPLVREAQM